MGRQRYSRDGYGMTQAEAQNNAYNDAERENGSQDGYSGDMNSDDGNMRVKCIRKPKPAKRCTIQKETQKGARKWVTKYVVQSRWLDGDIYNEYDSQGEGMKKAKEFVLATGKEVGVKIIKRLENGSNRVAVVSPKKCEMGIWRFSGEAMC